MAPSILIQITVVLTGRRRNKIMQNTEVNIGTEP